MTEGDAEHLVVDDFVLVVRRSARRKTVELTVDRGGELLIAAPPGVAGAALKDFVREKRGWLYEKIAVKEARQRAAVPREFVSGEGFPYLGRSYRLLLVEAQGAPLVLHAGRFRLRRDAATQGHEVFARWYTEHAHDWLPARLAPHVARVAAAPRALNVQDLGHRWASWSADATLNVHWTTMALPPGVIDYVLVHELVHHFVPNHTPEFWRRVARVLPDYEQRKAWLADHGARHVLL